MTQHIRYSLWILLATLTWGCRSYSRYPIDQKPIIKIDTAILGSWKAVEDTDRKNFLLIQNSHDAIPEGYYTDSADQVKHKDYYYYITYFNRHGKNPLYQQWTAFLSDINNEKFVNVVYMHEHVSGYLLVKLNINSTNDTITTALVADTALKYFHSSEYVRDQIIKHADDPAFYSDTLHFYKLNGYHGGLRGAVERSN